MSLMLMAAADAVKVAILWVLTGQSVAIGEQGEGLTLPPDLRQVDPNLRTASYRTSWPRPGQPITFTPPLESETLSMVPLEADVTAYSIYNYPISGSELTISRDLKAHYGGAINLAKIGFGGWPISHWLAGGAIRQAFQRVIPDVINQLLSEGNDTVKIPFVHMSHGESDAQLNRTDVQYFNDVDNFAQWFWALYPPYTNEVPFIFRDLSTMQTAITSMQRNNILSGIQMFVDKYPGRAMRFSVDQLPINIKTDQNIHWPLNDLQIIGSQVVPLAQSAGYL